MSSTYLPGGLGKILLPQTWAKPCGAAQWGTLGGGVRAVDIPPIGGWLFFETPAALVPDGLGGVFLLSTGRQGWLPQGGTGGSFTFRHISAAGAVVSAIDVEPPLTDVGAQGPQPQAALVPSGADGCILLWGWHQSQGSLVARQIIGTSRTSWGRRPVLLNVEDDTAGPPSNLAAESDGSGGAIAAWWTHSELPGQSARAQAITSYGKVRWPGGVDIGPSPLPTQPNPARWLQIVAGAATGSAIVVVPDLSAAGITYNAYTISPSGNLGAATTLAGPEPDSWSSWTRTRAVVTDGSGGLFLAYVDASSMLHLLRFTPGTGVRWDQILGTVADVRSYQVREDGSNGVLACWVSGTGTPRVHLQRIDGAGHVTWDVQSGFGGTSLEVFVPPASVTWLPDDWERLAQAVPNGAGGAILVYSDFSAASRMQKLYSVCFDKMGTAQGPSTEVRTRTGPQKLPMVAAADGTSAAIAWSDEDVNVPGSDVWANRTGCCPQLGIPYLPPFPCGTGSLEGMGYGEIPVSFPCGNRTDQYGVMPLMNLAQNVAGIDLPGSFGNRASPAPAWARLTFRGLPAGTTVQLCSRKGTLLATSRSSRTAVTLTFAPKSGPEDSLLIFRRKGKPLPRRPIAVRVEGKWGEGDPPSVRSGKPGRPAPVVRKWPKAPKR